MLININRLLSIYQHNKNTYLFPFDFDECLKYKIYMECQREIFWFKKKYLCDL